MADNRLILQCKCKKDYGVVLAKHYGVGWFTYDYNVLNGDPAVDLREYLNEYYEKHIMCFYELGDDCFHLCTEDDHEVLEEEEEEEEDYISKYTCEVCGETYLSRTYGHDELYNKFMEAHGINCKNKE